MIKTIMPFFFLLLIPVYSLGQPAPAKYGKIGEKDKNLTEYNGADAVILVDYGQYYLDARYGKVYFNFQRLLRIKILTEQGLKYAQQQIAYYDLHKATEAPFTRPYELRAQTLNIDAKGKIIKSKVKTRNIVETPADDEFNASLTLHFPDVKPGSIIEYEITIPTIETVNPAPWYFQYEIPTLWSELHIITPLDFNYAVKSYNTDFLDVAEVKSINPIINFPHRPISYSGNLYQFVKQNVPALPFSGDSADFNNSRMFINFMLEYASKKFLFPQMDELYKATDPEFKYLDRTAKQFQLTNAGYVVYAKPDPDHIAKELNKSDRFGIPLIMNMGLNDTIRKLVKDTKTTGDKIDTIYDFVRNNLEWNNKYRIFVDPGLPKFMVKLINSFSQKAVKTNTSLEKVMKKKAGTSSEINAVLINLLRANQINAFPVLISTLKNNYLDTSFFNLHQFNHMIAAVEMDGNILLLDAVNKNGKSILTGEPVNEFGLLIESKSARWIRVAIPYHKEPVSNTIQN